MAKILIGYDDNLGMPNDFAEAIGCELASYHILTPMLEAYANGELNALFIPAGTLPYVKNYNILSQSLFGRNNKITLRTNFVTTRHMEIKDIQKYIIGRVNQYCTTSFWAPLIYLRNYYPKNTVFNFQDTNGFKDMLYKTAENQIPSSMVWDIIMEQNPQLSAKVHQLFYKDDLPTPIIVGRKDFPQEVIKKINQFKTKDSQAFFRSFQDPDLKAIKKFQSDMQDASQYFNIPISEIQNV